MPTNTIPTLILEALKAAFCGSLNLIQSIIDKL